MFGEYLCLQFFILKVYMNNYCAIKSRPRACRKNLGIRRVHMPQINDSTDFKEYKNLMNRKLGLSSDMCRVKLNAPIFASQKEIHMQRARNIAKTLRKKKRVPVIMLRDKSGQYLVVDGHHRWLAYHFLGRNKTRKTMPAYVTDVKSLRPGFKKINKTLRNSKHHFHKGHHF